MLIVKGNKQKSVLAQILVHNTQSICFEYCEYPVMYFSYCVDSEIYSLSEFMEFMAQELDTLRVEDRHLDYLIIYTNEKEEDLKELINWVNENERTICFKDVLVMCKE